MIISNSNNFIFIHIPKTGGTSVNYLLDSELKWNDIVLGGTEFGEICTSYWSPRFKLHKHSLPNDIKSVMGANVYKKYKKFIVVRDPLSRIISSYNFIKNLREKSVDWYIGSDECKLIGELKGLNSFIQSEYFNIVFDSAPEVASDIRRFFMPQHIYFDKEEWLADRFLFFKLEDLILSTSPLKESGFIYGSNSLPKENSSPYSDLYIDDCSYELIFEKYKDDYDIFNYKKQRLMQFSGEILEFSKINL